MAHPRILRHEQITSPYTLINEYIQGELSLFELVIFDLQYNECKLWKDNIVKEVGSVIDNGFLMGLKGEELGVGGQEVVAKLDALRNYINQVNTNDMPSVAILDDSETMSFIVRDTNGDVLESFMDIEEAENWCIDNGYDVTEEYSNLPEPEEGFVFEGQDVSLEECQQNGYLICELKEGDHFDKDKEYRFYMFDFNPYGGYTKTWIYCDVSWNELVEMDWVDWKAVLSYTGGELEEPTSHYDLMVLISDLCSYYGSAIFPFSAVI